MHQKVACKRKSGFSSSPPSSVFLLCVAILRNFPCAISICICWAYVHTYPPVCFCPIFWEYPSTNHVCCFSAKIFFTALPAFCGQRSRRRQSSIPVLFRRSCVSVCVCDGAWVVYVSCKQNAKEYAEKQNKYNAAKSELERQQQQRPILNF